MMLGMKISKMSCQNRGSEGWTFLYTIIIGINLKLNKITISKWELFSKFSNSKNEKYILDFDY